MWHSYHIYLHDRTFFLQQLHRLQGCYQNSELFFIQYLDQIGYHFRLRVRSEEPEEVEHMIKDYFGNYRILKKIYDPEYSLFMEALPTYEEYSVKLTEFLVKYRGILPHHYIEDIIKQLLQHFNCNHSRFIQSYMTYWKGYARFQNNHQQESLRQQLSTTVDSPPFSNIISILNSLGEHHLSEDFCFKFLHMTLNKFGFSIPDELVILSIYLKQQQLISTSK
ncbi:lantibiotic dehydratase C-terminal domain-containing protein [Viridibacillus sp. NPDC093762]|uniref:lantibiotic dehydratase C-terminal domain-containing protein n=1 Tax=Viridibacillus sp. NPDC093762 TaxID=3390720 RepID=UPI003D070C34